MEFGNYGDYQSWPFQVLGVLSVLLVLGTVFVGVANSRVFAGFVRYADEREEWEEDGTDEDNVEMARGSSSRSRSSSHLHRVSGPAGGGATGPGDAGAGGGDYKNMDMLEKERTQPEANDGVLNYEGPVQGNRDAVLT